MNHADHVKLIRNGIPSPGGVWADFGSGTGAFTAALVELLGPQGEIHSIDLDRHSLQTQEQRLKQRFPMINMDYIHFHHADFTKPVHLPPLDGVVMANALHFFEDKIPVLRLIQNYLRSEGRLILVEYNVDRGNRWIPFPLSYESWKNLAIRSGFRSVQLLEKVRSSFLYEFYSSAAW